mmetsp:Transcript_66983/g.190009  ORF Transcript_66983/g.190009 Transcript_66983/m.190009 type:complete len:298 (-) Transcript_66983:1597-2490(-)
MSSMFSTFKRVSTSPAASSFASKASPSTARTTASAAVGRPVWSSAGGAAPARPTAAPTLLASSSASLGPAARRRWPSRATEAATASQCACTSAASAEKPGHGRRCSTTAFVVGFSSPGPEVPSAVAPPAADGGLPAAMLAASALVRAGAWKENASVAGTTSSAGASTSPALASPSSTSMASFWAPAPMSPLRRPRRIFSSAGMMLFCSLGEPPAVFQTPPATRFTAASASAFMTKARQITRSRTSRVEQSSVVRRSWPNFLCSRIFSATLPRRPATFSLVAWLRARASGVLECTVAA